MYIRTVPMIDVRARSRYSMCGCKLLLRVVSGQMSRVCHGPTDDEHNCLEMTLYKASISLVSNFG